MTEEVALDAEATNVPDQVVESESEEMLPKSRVEELVKKAKLKGRDSMQAELDALKAENEKLKGSNGGSMGGMAIPVDPEAIKQQVLNDLKQQFQQESEKRAQEELEKQAKQIANTYHSKMAAGKDQFQDFDDVMADFNPAAFPNLVALATEMDNMPAVLYEAMKSPSKLASLAIMSERDPNAAKNMLAKLSNSIKANEQAKAEEKDVAPPLSRLSASTTGQDSGERSIRDFKKMFRG